MRVVPAPVWVFLCSAAPAGYISKLFFTSLLKTIFNSGLFELLMPFLFTEILPRLPPPPSFHDYQKATSCRRNEIPIYHFLALISRNCAKSYHSELYE